MPDSEAYGLDGVNRKLRHLEELNKGGKLVRKKEKVIIKWHGERPLEVPEHQEWPMFALTEMGFALVRDPWGKPHCLPPRDARGDVKYELRRGTWWKSWRVSRTSC